MEYYENFFENEQMYITSMYTINNQIIWLVNWALQESIKMVVAVALDFQFSSFIIFEQSVCGLN